MSSSMTPSIQTAFDTTEANARRNLLAFSSLMIIGFCFNINLAGVINKHLDTDIAQWEVGIVYILFLTYLTWFFRETSEWREFLDKYEKYKARDFFKNCYKQRPLEIKKEDKHYSLVRRTKLHKGFLFDNFIIQQSLTVHFRSFDERPVAEQVIRSESNDFEVYPTKYTKDKLNKLSWYFEDHFAIPTNCDNFMTFKNHLYLWCVTPFRLIKYLKMDAVKFYPVSITTFFAYLLVSIGIFTPVPLPSASLRHDDAYTTSASYAYPKTTYYYLDEARYDPLHSP